MSTYQPQTLVRVLPAYPARDGNEGIWTVLGTAGRDVLLAWGDVRDLALAPEAWDLAVRESRLEPV